MFSGKIECVRVRFVRKTDGVRPIFGTIRYFLNIFFTYLSTVLFLGFTRINTESIIGKILWKYSKISVSFKRELSCTCTRVCVLSAVL